MMTAAARRTTRTTGPEPDSRSLAGEHVRLLRDVQRRADSVLALLAARSWPEAELRTLTGFLRTAVLRQASDEEVLLYPAGASAGVTELAAEHAQLYALADQLDRADASSCTLAELRELLAQLTRVLEHHLIQEHAVLAALTEAPATVPAVATLAAGSKTWLPRHDRPVLIMLDALPSQQAVQMCIERLLRLRPGQSAEIHSSNETDLQQVCGWIHSFDSARYGLTRLDTELSQRPLQVTRRRTAAPHTICDEEADQ